MILVPPWRTVPGWKTDIGLDARLWNSCLQNIPISRESGANRWNRQSGECQDHKTLGAQQMNDAAETPFSRDGAFSNQLRDDDCCREVSSTSAGHSLTRIRCNELKGSGVETRKSERTLSGVVGSKQGAEWCDETSILFPVRGYRHWQHFQSELWAALKLEQVSE